MSRTIDQAYNDMPFGVADTLMGPTWQLSELAKSDAKAAARTLSPHEARFLCDFYYDVQEFRKASANRVRALTTAEEPHQAITYVYQQVNKTEDTIRQMLDEFSASRPEGRWVRQITGIGPASLAASPPNRSA